MFICQLYFNKVGAGKESTATEGNTLSFKRMRQIYTYKYGKKAIYTFQLKKIKKQARNNVFITTGIVKSMCILYTDIYPCMYRWCMCIYQCIYTDTYGF